MDLWIYRSLCLIPPRAGRFYSSHITTLAHHFICLDCHLPILHQQSALTHFQWRGGGTGWWRPSWPSLIFLLLCSFYVLSGERVESNWLTNQGWTHWAVLGRVCPGPAQKDRVINYSNVALRSKFLGVILTFPYVAIEWVCGLIWLCCLGRWSQDMKTWWNKIWSQPIEIWQAWRRSQIRIRTDIQGRYLPITESKHILYPPYVCWSTSY
jgi:hypothetical protein